jgi:hypothetical protein
MLNNIGGEMLTTQKQTVPKYLQPIFVLTSNIYHPKLTMSKCLQPILVFPSVRISVESVAIESMFGKNGSLA